MSKTEYEDYCTNHALKWICKCCSDKARNEVLSQEDDVGNIYGNLANEMQASRSGMKIGHLNVNGLLNKIHEIFFLLSETKFDILALSETHLHKNVSDSLIQIDGYQIARLDREQTNKKLRGCLIYFKNTLDAFERLDLKGHSNTESVWIEITAQSQKLLLGCTYRPPDDLGFYDNFMKVIEPLWAKRNNIINGGFNFRSESQKFKTREKATCSFKTFWFKECNERPNKNLQNSKYHH